MPLKEANQGQIQEDLCFQKPLFYSITAEKKFEESSHCWTILTVKTATEAPLHWNPGSPNENEPYEIFTLIFNGLI